MEDVVHAPLSDPAIVVTPMKKRSRRKIKQTQSTRGKSDKEVAEENVAEVKGVRRSTRLSKQGPLMAIEERM
jgi:hypothetical protein